MINRIVPMASPFFALCSSQRETLDVEKDYTGTACGSLSPDLTGNRSAKGWRRRSGLPIGRSNCVGGLENMETGTGQQKAPSLLGRWVEQEGAWREMVLTFGLNPRRELHDQPSCCRLSRHSERELELRLSPSCVRHLHQALSRSSSHR